MRIIVRAEAEADITDAAVWYEQQRSALANEFLAEIETSLNRISISPRRYPRLRRIPDVRRALVDRFPYRIFFVVQPDTVVVFRVLHAARHDRQW